MVLLLRTAGYLTSNFLIWKHTLYLVSHAAPDIIIKPRCVYPDRVHKKLVIQEFPYRRPSSVVNASGAETSSSWFISGTLQSSLWAHTWEMEPP